MVQSIFKFLKCLEERRLPQDWVFLPSGELGTPEIKIASVTVPTFKDNKRVSKRNVIPLTMYSLQGLSQDFSKGGHTLSNKGYSPQFSPPECCRSFAQRHTNRGSQAPQSVIFMKKEVSSCKMSNVIFEINVINITWKHYFIKNKLDGQHLSLVCELCILQLLSIKDTMTSLWVVVMVHSPLACSCSSKDQTTPPPGFSWFSPRKSLQNR